MCQYGLSRAQRTSRDRSGPESLQISATRDAIEAVRRSDASLICVGTPPGPNGHTDATAVINVAQQLSGGIAGSDRFHVVVIRSTVPPGTNRELCGLIASSSGKAPNRDFAVVSNPEFLREGSSIKDYYDPPFTLVGTDCDRAVEVMKQLYSGLDAQFVVSGIGVAEMIKYVSNSFHALKVSFANEIGNICKKLDVNSHDLMEVFCLDRKLNLGPYYLKPGFAFGGSCLPKDLKGLNMIARDLYVDCPVLESIERSNDLQKNLVLRKIQSFEKKNIGFVGLSFKAGTDDLRNSPIIDIIEQLIGKGYRIRVYDRNVHLSKLIGGNRQFIFERLPMIADLVTENLQDVIDHSEVVVVVNREPALQAALEDSGKTGGIVFDLVNLGLADANEDWYCGIAW
jgi:GDP-mannose 6-dehydrogenase